MTDDRRPRYRVDCNLVQWHVVDSIVEAELGLEDGVEAKSPHSVAFWQRNQVGDAFARKKAEALCDLLNGEEPKKSPAEFLNRYECPDCMRVWHGVWSRAVNDKCPDCGRLFVDPVDCRELT